MNSNLMNGMKESSLNERGSLTHGFKLFCHGVLIIAGMAMVSGGVQAMPSSHGGSEHGGSQHDGADATRKPRRPLRAQEERENRLETGSLVSGHHSLRSGWTVGTSTALAAALEEIGSLAKESKGLAGQNEALEERLRTLQTSLDIKKAAYKEQARAALAKEKEKRTALSAKLKAAMASLREDLEGQVLRATTEFERVTALLAERDAEVEAVRREAVVKDEAHATELERVTALLAKRDAELAESRAATAIAEDAKRAAQQALAESIQRKFAWLTRLAGEVGVEIDLPPVTRENALQLSVASSPMKGAVMGASHKVRFIDLTRDTIDLDQLNGLLDICHRDLQTISLHNGIFEGSVRRTALSTAQEATVAARTGVENATERLRAQETASEKIKREARADLEKQIKAILTAVGPLASI